MRPAVLSLSLLCSLVAVEAIAQDATAIGGGVRCAPVAQPAIPAGTRLYTPDSDLSQAGEYPRAARIGAIEGDAAVDCQIGNDGYMTRCVVASESRAGYGLGEGLAVTVLKWAQTDTAKPGHKPGSWLRFKTNWKLPAGQAPAAQVAAAVNADASR